MFITEPDSANISTAHLLSVEEDIRRREKQLDTLADELANADSPRIKRVLSTRMQELDQELDKLSLRRHELERQIESDHTARARKNAFKIIKEMGPDDFWRLPQHEINGILRGLLGTWRLVMSNGQIVGICKKPPMNAHKKKKG